MYTLEISLLKHYTPLTIVNDLGMWCMCYSLPPDHTVGRTAQAAPQETVVVDGDHCRSNNVTHEGTLSHKTAPLEEPAPGPAHPPVALNAQARAREQQRWIWVV